MKRHLLAVLFTLAAAITLPAQQLLNYTLQSSSTYTPHNGSVATGHSQHLTGSFSLIPVPSNSAGSEQFIVTNLSLFYTSNSLTLDATSGYDVATEVPPSHEAIFPVLVDFNGDSNAPLFLGGIGKATYSGPDTAPTEFKVTDGLTDTNDLDWIAYVTINAKLIPLPVRPAITNLASFNGTNGIMSESGLLVGRDGSLYGTTMLGGTNNLGGIYKLTSTNKLLEAVSFRGTNGSAPQGGLVLGKDGNFYGTTSGGGRQTNGTIFRMTLTGVVSNLFFFNGTDGAMPAAGLVLGKDGNFYGTTYFGGAFNEGTVFKISPQGKFTMLASFSGGNGSHPEAPLVQDKDGNFYGTTVYGGGFYTGESFSGWGCVFRVTPAGAISVIGSFTGIDGAGPVAALTPTSSGELYGTTAWGGDNFADAPFTGDGTVFKVGEGGGIITLHYFDENAIDGFQPQFSALVQGSKGNFLGTTFLGGQEDGGTIFEMTPTGTLTTLISFQPAAGANPIGGLSTGENATTFYGTTTSGGIFDLGTVFRLSLPKAP